MTDASIQRLPDEPNPLRRALGCLLLLLALGVLAAATLLTYGLTREYGYSPNDDPLQDLTQAALGHTLGGLMVAGLAVAGVNLMVQLSLRRQLLFLVGAFLAAFLVLTVGMVLGQRALDVRCAGPDRYSTGAC
jgi:type IV secretory pathway VirB2 component (pilin)